MGLAGCGSGQLSYRWISCRPGRGWSRFRRVGADRGSHRGLDHRSGRMVCAEAVGLMALDPGDEHRNGRGSHRRRGTCRLRDKPRGPADHGCGHRARCRRVAGAGARKIPRLRGVLVGGRKPTSVGTWLARDLLRDHQKRSGPVHELRRERSARLRAADVAPPRSVVPRPEPQATQ